MQIQIEKEITCPYCKGENKKVFKIESGVGVGSEINFFKCHGCHQVYAAQINYEMRLKTDINTSVLNWGDDWKEASGKP